MLPDKLRVIKRKIGELLLERRLINKDVLEEALGFQKTYGVSLGTYLVKHGYVTEKDIVECLSSQYGFPYISLANFRIDNEVVNLVPVSIATKYSLIPIDRMYGLITVAMANPLDEQAIDSVKSISGCDVQIFIATISDINSALETYYGINVYEEETAGESNYVNSGSYNGKDRRKFFRFKANIDIHFAYQDKFRKESTRDISAGGVSFYSINFIPVDTYLTLEISLPHAVINRPIASVIKVVRTREVEPGRFEIGARFVQLDSLDRAVMIKYAKDSAEFDSSGVKV